MLWHLPLRALDHHPHSEQYLFANFADVTVHHVLLSVDLGYREIDRPWPARPEHSSSPTLDWQTDRQSAECHLNTHTYACTTTLLFVCNSCLCSFYDATFFSKCWSGRFLVELKNLFHFTLPVSANFSTASLLFVRARAAEVEEAERHSLAMTHRRHQLNEISRLASAHRASHLKPNAVYEYFTVLYLSFVFCNLPKTNRGGGLLRAGQ